MWRPPDAILLAVSVDGPRVVGCSAVPILADALTDHHRAEQPLPLSAHAVMPGTVKVTTGEGAIDFGLYDGNGTLLLEWRLEGMSYEAMDTGRGVTE